jgi:hypothetical protein
MYTTRQRLHAPSSLYQLQMERSMCHCQWCESRPRPAACVIVNDCKSCPHPPATDRSPSKRIVHLDADTHVQSQMHVHDQTIECTECSLPISDGTQHVSFSLINSIGDALLGNHWRWWRQPCKQQRQRDCSAIMRGDGDNYDSDNGSEQQATMSMSSCLHLVVLNMMLQSVALNMILQSLTLNIILHICISHDGVLLYVPCAHAWLLFVLTQPVG